MTKFLSKLYIYEGFVFAFTGPFKKIKGRTILRGLFGLVFLTGTTKNGYFTGLIIYSVSARYCFKEGKTGGTEGPLPPPSPPSTSILSSPNMVSMLLRASRDLARAARTIASAVRWAPPVTVAR